MRAIRILAEHRLTFVVVLGVGLSASTLAAQTLSSTPHAFIRVIQDNGVWWFQDGAGHRFFSVGVNCVGDCYGHAEDTPIAPARKTWIVALLKEWRFNTAACWSSPSVWDDLYVADQMYPEFVPSRDDVFDEAFWTGGFAEQLTREVRPFLGRKSFIGYFLDNEPDWKAREIFAFYARLGQGRAGSRAFLAYLRRYYQGNIRTLNHDWGTAYVSFEQIPGTRPPTRYAARMKRGILKAWRLEVAATYYRRYAAMVRALDPDHLLLGIRYRGVPDLELFSALAPYFDVNSINDYNRYGHLKPSYAAFKPTRVDALVEPVPVDHTYFMAWDPQSVYVAGEISTAHLARPHPKWAWTGDYLAIDLRPEDLSEGGAAVTASMMIYPIGGGADTRQPYAWYRYGPEDSHPIPLRVKMRLKPGGYTIEARIPAPALVGFHVRPGATWHMMWRYQNVHELYQTHWEGILMLGR